MGIGEERAREISSHSILVDQPVTKDENFKITSN